MEATGKLQFGPVTAATVPLPEISNGAFNLSDDEFQAKFGIPKPRLTDEVIFSCRSGQRSARAALAAEKAGYQNIFNYQGSANVCFIL